MAIISIILWVVLAIIVFFSGIRIVRPTELALIERLGKYKKTAKQGFHWIIPVIDQMIKVNITERMVDIQPQATITKDDLNATVDAIVYYKVKDPFKAVYAADNFKIQIASLARTTLRDIIGKMSLSDANSKRNELNVSLEKELDTQTNAWGIDIIRVELQRIEPPGDVQASMNNVVKAEREKIAATDLATAAETRADGERRAKIKMADGVKQSLVLEAKGRAEAITTIADAKAQEIKVVNTSLQIYFKNQAVQHMAYETTQIALSQNTKYVIDSKSNLVNVMSEAAGIPFPVEKKK